jgi:histidyl-tRNA synthetase
MGKSIPRTLKGFRDFLPAEKSVRDRLERKIVEVFQRFGFQPVETPTLEYAALILGKYGEEADRLVYTFEDRGKRRVALPYDQTVPTARVLTQHQRELPRYFRRYAIRNVFRAENPQRGRYREFKQCDIDIFGSDSPLADAEIVACTYFAFRNVGFSEIQIRLNDRAILFESLEPFAGDGPDVFSIIRSVDKLDKMSEEDVIEELVAKGMTETRAREALTAIQGASPSANLQAIIDAVRRLGVPDSSVVFAPMLARGLDYYTGPIFEVFLPGFASGSLAGGGRYDRLIEQLGGPATPATGIAFGFDRVVEAAVHLKVVPAEAPGAEVLVAVFDEASCPASLELAAAVRNGGISCEVYPAADKIGKQLKLANQKKIPVVLIVGPDELKEGTATLRDMRSGDQSTVARVEIVDAVKRTLGGDA